VDDDKDGAVGDGGTAFMGRVNGRTRRRTSRCGPKELLVRVTLARSGQA
jgi:hypothetical protein